jgi:hypothetical protein
MQGSSHKTITWTKKLKNERQEWEKACVEKGLWFQKLKTIVKTRFVENKIC